MALMKPTSRELLLTRTPQCQSRRHPGGWSALSTRYWYHSTQKTVSQHHLRKTLSTLISRNQYW